LKLENYVVMHRIPQLFNNRISVLDASFTRFSTSVDEKRLRKTILAPRCQQLWNNP
jgi:hypothetical protein